MKESKIEIGQVVTTTIKMTVRKVNEDGSVTCNWFDEFDQLHEGKFKQVEKL